MASVIMAIAVWVGRAVAEPGGGSIEDDPLTDLLDLMDDQVDAPTSVADGVARSRREASALVTVITGEELRRLGARDLMDALALIPSVDFSTDLWNTAILNVRGGNGERVLVLIDGHPWNEMFYGITTMGNRLPATLIDRIEVIRGPGSAIYGQNAMFAVIRVVTVGGAIEGVRVDARTSWLPSGVYGRQDLSASVGGALGPDGHLGVSAALGRGRRSDSPYTDIYGGTVDLTGSSDLDPAFVSGSLAWKGLEIALAAEQYRTTWIDGGVRIYRRDHDNWFSDIAGRISYSAPVSEHMNLRTWIASRFDEPWRSTRAFDEEAYGYFRDRGDRTVAGVELDEHPIEQVRGVLGAEGGFERAHSTEPDVGAVTTYPLGAAWAELGYDSEIVDVLAGARLDVNTAFGEAVSPRVVVGEAYRRFHYKAAINRAFRAPGFVHARYGVDPETSTTGELELGVGPTAWSYLTASAFAIALDDPMLYRYEADPLTGIESEAYVNGDPMVTTGIEAELEVLWGPLTASVGWAGLRAGRAPPDWDVPVAPRRLLAVPASKGVVRASVDTGERLTLGAVGTWMGPRWTIPQVTASGGPVYGEVPAAVVFDASAELRHLGLRGLSVAVSVHDLLNQDPPLLQSYYALHAPAPGTGREILLDLRFER